MRSPLLRTLPLCGCAALLLLAVGPGGCTARGGGEPEKSEEAAGEAGTVGPVEPLEPAAPVFPPEPLPAFTPDDAGAPLSLTASDGTGLRLVALKARAVVQGPLAFTELHLTFDNPRPQTIEGHFTIDLPNDSAISRFAMKIGERWQEGEVVERQAARAAYEDFLHRRQDPALLENQAGNRFSARVFPIPAGGRKELIVSYSQELTDSEVPYKLMLAGLPKMEDLDVEILVDEDESGGGATSVGGSTVSRAVIEVKKKDFAPDKDLEVSSPRSKAVVGLRHENLAVARVAAVGDMPPDPVEDVTILFDTSASRALGFGSQLHRLGKLIEALSRQGDPTVRLVAFDQEQKIVYDGKASAFGSEPLHTLYSRRALGASDLQGALQRVALAGPGSRVIVVSDGIATAGHAEAGELEAAVKRLAMVGVQRLDAIIDGGLQDREVLEALTTAGLPKDGIVVDARLEPDLIAAKLSRATLSNVRVDVPGSRFSWPKVLHGVQPGDEVLVYADLPEDVAMKVVLEGSDTIEREVPLADVPGPLLERSLAAARIDDLMLQRSELPADATDARAQLGAKIIELSTKYRVLSDLTALLVLETEADYQRFSIDRNALADILTVGPSGIDLIHRVPESIADWTLTPPPPPPPPPPPITRHDRPPTQGGEPIEEVVPGVMPSSEGGAPAEADRDFDGGNEERSVAADPASPMPEPEPVRMAEASDEAKAESAPPAAKPRASSSSSSAKRSRKSSDDLGRIAFEDDDRGGRSGKGGGSNYGRGSSPLFDEVEVPPTLETPETQITVRGGGLDAAQVHRAVRSRATELTRCFGGGSHEEGADRGSLEVTFAVDAEGVASSSALTSTTVSDVRVAACVLEELEQLSFASPAGAVDVTMSLSFGKGTAAGRMPFASEQLAEARRQLAAERAERKRQEELQRRIAEEAKRAADSPYEGRMFLVMMQIEDRRFESALQEALTWHHESPGDVLALVAMGEALEGMGNAAAAARVYGSIIDLFPSRADLRRFAGYRLERLQDAGLKLAVDTYRHAVQERPDHPNSHRLYAYALVRAGRQAEAFDAIVAGKTHSYPSDRFRGVDEILRDDVGLVAAAWIAAEPERRKEIEARVQEVGATIPTGPSTRFVISWETDANDVDFHIYDGNEAHAYYSSKDLPSGGRLYADVTTGYGPECFTIEGKPTAFPYRFEAHYYSRGPMGYGMGKLQILEHDGKGGLLFEERPFLIMKDRAFVKLGTLTAPLE